MSKSSRIYNHTFSTAALPSCQMRWELFFLVHYKYCFLFLQGVNLLAAITIVKIIFLWLCDSTRVMASSFLRFLDHAQPLITVGRTPLDEWSARRRDLYLKTHNTHNRKTIITPVGFEPTIAATECPKIHALDRAATDIGTVHFSVRNFTMNKVAAVACRPQYILWNNQQMQLYAVNLIPLLGSLYMFRVFYTPIIRSTIYNCIYSHWYKQ